MVFDDAAVRSLFKQYIEVRLLKPFRSCLWIALHHQSGMRPQSTPIPALWIIHHEWPVRCSVAA